MVHDDVRHSHLTTVEAAVESALEEQQIYDIGSYGWVGPDEPDPDLIGHAMWQTDVSLPDF